MPSLVKFPTSFNDRLGLLGIFHTSNKIFHHKSHHHGPCCSAPGAPWQQDPRRWGFVPRCGAASAWRWGSAWRMLVQIFAGDDVGDCVPLKKVGSTWRIIPFFAGWLVGILKKMAYNIEKILIYLGRLYYHSLHGTNHMFYLPTLP